MESRQAKYQLLQAEIEEQCPFDLCERWKLSGKRRHLLDLGWITEKTK